MEPVIENKTVQQIEVNDEIIFFVGVGVFSCIVTKVTEKAVKVDYDNSSVWSNGITVYTKTGWIPKSVLTKKPEDILYSVKSWFRFKETFHIKKYYIEKGNKNYI